MYWNTINISIDRFRENPRKWNKSKWLMYHGCARISTAMLQNIDKFKKQGSYHQKHGLAPTNDKEWCCLLFVQKLMNWVCLCICYLVPAFFVHLTIFFRKSYRVIKTKVLIQTKLSFTVHISCVLTAHMSSDKWDNACNFLPQIKRVYTWWIRVKK